jgi:protein TonB
MAASLGKRMPVGLASGMTITAVLIPLAFALTNPVQPGPASAHPATRTRLRDPGQQLLTSNDYPMEAEQFHATGDVIFRVIVGADGNVEECRILRQTQVAAFGRVTCEIMRTRARFEPARDAAGNPVRDYFDGRFVFTSPGPPHNRRRPRPRPVRTPPPFPTGW